MIKVKEIAAPFVGLNKRAIEYLMKTGYWCEIEDLVEGAEEYENPEGRFGLIYSDLLGKTPNHIVCGILVDGAAIPAFLHDIVLYTTKDGEEKQLPLFRYLLNDKTSVAEKVDVSVRFADGRPGLYLINHENVEAFRWDERDIQELRNKGYEIKDL